MESSIFTMRTVVLGWVLALTLSSCDGPQKNQSTGDPVPPSAKDQNPVPLEPTAVAAALETTALSDDVDVTSLCSDSLAADKSLPLPLLAVGRLDAAEDEALTQCLMQYRLVAADGDLSPLERFLASFPQGMRSHALRNNLAQLYYSRGEFSKSYAMWNEAWNAAKNLDTPMGLRLADDAFAGLARLLVLLGRKEDLSSLLSMATDRPLNGVAAEGRLQATEALSSMENWQEQAFKCGPFALFRIRAQLGLPEPLHPLIEEEKSTVKGTSMAQLVRLSERIEMPMRAVKITGEQIIPTPSVVYWKLGHYSAITAVDSKGSYIVEDTTFSHPIHITPEVMRAESSGYYLVLVDSVTDSQAVVSNAQAGEIWGRMSPPTNDPDDLGPEQPDDCNKGMAGWSLGKLNTNLRISDTPISYSPAIGPDVAFTVTFNARDSSQSSTPNYSNIGLKWTFNWLQFIVDNPTQPLANVKRQRAGGGLETYHTFDEATGYYALQSRSSTKLQKTGADSYILWHPDGSREVFGQPDGVLSGSRRIFLTKQIDASGNELNFQYDASKRLVKLIDAVGKETTISYGYAADPFRITSITDPYGRTSTLAYHPSGRLASTTDTIGIQSKFIYDSSLELTMLSTPYGDTKFDTLNVGTSRQVTITNPLGHRTRYQTVIYSPAAAGIPDGLTAQEDVNPEVPVATTGYSTRVTYHWGEKAMHFFEGDHSKATQYFWMESAVSSYVGIEVLKAVRKPYLGMVFFQYPNQTAPHLAGTLDKPITTATRLPDGQVQISRAEYNAWGQPVKLTDPLGRETLIDYDPNGQLAVKVRQKVASGHETLSEILSYNAAFQPLQIKDAAGKISTLTYNSRSQLDTITDHLGETITTTYQENPAAPGYARPLSVVSNRGPSTTITYDALDRPASTTNQDGYRVAYEYDAFDRLEKTTYPDATTERFEYRFLDLVKTYDREGKVSETGYNASRQPVWTRDSLNRLTQYEWCLCGALQKLTDPAGNETHWEWNISGQNLSKTYADGRKFTHTYDGSGRLIATLDPKGQTTRLTYNTDGSVASKNYDNAVVATSPVSYAYDPFYPRLASWTDALGTTTNTYHPADGMTPGAGGLASVDGPWANDTIAYLHDAQGRPSGYTLPGGGESHTYDSLNRIATSTSVTGTLTRTYQGTSSRVLSAIPASGPKVIMTYGTAAEDFRLKEISNQTSAGAIISQHNYAFTKDSQIATWNRTYGLGTSPPAAETYHFGYDQADRLTSGALKNTATGAVLADHQFLYDPVDNQLSIRENSSLKSGTFNNANQLTGQSGGGKVRITGAINKSGASVTVAGQPAAVHPQGGYAVEVQAAPGANHFPLVVTEADGTVTTKHVDLFVENSIPVIHSYDANGNLESVAPQAAPGSPTRTYQWDAANRLVGITRILSPTETRKTEFLYSGEGARVGKKELLNEVVDSDIRYFYGGTGVLQERSADGGTVTKTYTPQGELNYTTTPPSPRYYTRDHLGSVREVVAEDETLVARYDYKPYGERILVSGSYEAAKGYTGHDYLPEAGTILTQYRAYDPGTGRWLSSDPLGEEGGMNLYGYVRGDPLNSVDPLGLIDAPFKRALVTMALMGALGGMSERAAENGGAAYQAAICDEAELIPDLLSPPEEFIKDGAIGTVIGVVTGGVIKAGGPLVKNLVGRMGKRAASATQIAQEGGRHAGQLQQFLKQTPDQLQRTIRSFDKLIAKHEGWIADPASKVPNFSQLRPEHQQNLLHHWRQDIARHQELRSIAQDILK
jgi:RHS repeat-associated protein